MPHQTISKHWCGEDEDDYYYLLLQSFAFFFLYDLLIKLRKCYIFTFFSRKAFLRIHHSPVKIKEAPYKCARWAIVLQQMAPIIHPHFLSCHLSKNRSHFYLPLLHCYITPSFPSNLFNISEQKKIEKRKEAHKRQAIVLVHPPPSLHRAHHHHHQWIS